MHQGKTTLALNISETTPSRGAEVDLVLEFPGGAKGLSRIKHSSTPSVSKGFYTGCDDIKADKRFVVYSGTDKFSMGENITVISLPGLMLELLKAVG